MKPTTSCLPDFATLRLKKTVRARLTAAYRPQLPAALLRRALDDAAELACNSGFPQLFFPALAEEKVRLVAQTLSGDAPNTTEYSVPFHAAA